MSLVDTTKDGERIEMPRKILENWRFMARVDTECGKTIYTRVKREKDDSPIRGVTFGTIRVTDTPEFREATDEELDSVAFPYHILTLGKRVKPTYHYRAMCAILELCEKACVKPFDINDVDKKTFKKEPGETFSHREVLDALLEVDNEARVKSRDVDNIYFCGMNYNSRYRMYVPEWISATCVYNNTRKWCGE